MSAQAYPLYWPEGWKRTKYQKKSPFRVTGFGKVRDFLISEVRRMGGTSVVLSSNIPLRNDGLPYANASNPSDSGVAIYFLYQKKKMSFACDSYRMVADNAYAIAKTIEALRGIERWGASDMMERAFSGFKALASATEREWWDVLQVNRSCSRDVIESNFRSLLRTRHPDAGGSHEAMTELYAARAKALKEVA